MLWCLVKLYKLKRIVQQVFYDDLVYKFKRNVGKPSFPDQMIYFIKRYNRMEYYNKSVCLVINESRMIAVVSRP